jgi:hypothetical protein
MLFERVITITTGVSCMLSKEMYTRNLYIVCRFLWLNVNVSNGISHQWSLSLCFALLSLNVMLVRDAEAGEEFVTSTLLA